MNADLQSTIPDYRRYVTRQRLFLAGMCACVLLLTLVSLNAGSTPLSPMELLKAIFTSDNTAHSRIIWNVRLPRILAAIIAGSGLALAGCAMQNVLKNPMASPSTLGVSNAAVFGVNLAIIVLQACDAQNAHNPYLVTTCAFTFAIASTLLILMLSLRQGLTPEIVVLAGVALGSLFAAGTTILQFFAVDTQLSSAVFWTFGDLGRATLPENAMMATVVLTALVFFYAKRWSFNALATSEELARSLGVRTERLRVLALLLASLVCAVCVAFLGIIGFVGLVAPQLVRRFTGNDYRFLLPGSALGGAIMLLVADIIARALLTGTTLPVGAITSLFGGPMFLWILLKRKRKHWK